MKRIFSYILEHNWAFVTVLIVEVVVSMMAAFVIALLMLKFMLWLMKVLL